MTRDRIEGIEEIEERKIGLENLARGNSEINFRNRTWENLLETSFFIGEIHSHLNPKKFLIQNMELLSQRGYSVIFMEHLEADLQEDLDTYLTRSGRDTPEELRASLSHTTTGYLDDTVNFVEMVSEVDAEPYKTQSRLFNYNAVVREAAKVGIKVIPLEISRENYKNFARGEGRMAYLNSNAVDVVAREVGIKPDLKYIGLVGAGHLLRKNDVPGICEALAIQDVMIYDVILPGTAWSTLSGGISLPRIIYEGSNVDKKNISLKDSAMGLTMSLSEDLYYERNILPFYNDSKVALETINREVPSSAMETLRNPENPFKRIKQTSSTSNDV